MKNIKVGSDVQRCEISSPSSHDTITNFNSSKPRNTFNRLTEEGVFGGFRDHLQYLLTLTRAPCPKPGHCAPDDPVTASPLDEPTPPDLILAMTHNTINQSQDTSDADVNKAFTFHHASQAFAPTKPHGSVSSTSKSIAHSSQALCLCQNQHQVATLGV